MYIVFTLSSQSVNYLIFNNEKHVSTFNQKCILAYFFVTFVFTLSVFVYACIVSLLYYVQLKYGWYFLTQHLVCGVVWYNNKNNVHLCTSARVNMQDMHKTDVSNITQKP